jgi:hypothetical protein
LLWSRQTAVAMDRANKTTTHHTPTLIMDLVSGHGRGYRGHVHAARAADDFYRIIDIVAE